MFCIYCGAKIGEAANFCIKCGKPVAKKTDGKNQTTAEPTPSTPNNTARENIQQMVLTSISRVANSRGYYCFNCGCYVDRQRAAYNGDVRCVECGTPMIKPNFTSHVGNSVARYGLIGGALHSVFETTNYVQNSPVNYVRSYYYSAYYHQTKYPFEMVATDKGKMGEYLVEVGFQLAKSVFRNLKPYIFFNLLIPEANGSFQEIDALVIIGAAIYVIEAKNRSGIFSMNAISDKFWSFQSYSGDSSRVYSPLMQNSEHVVALQSYLADKLDFNPTFFNYVTLSGSGCIDWNIQTDEIDSILLGNWKISNTRGIARTFNEDFKIFTEEMSTEDYSQGDRLLDEKYALKTIEALKPILEMPEEKKRAKQKDRMANDSNGGKTAYNYFYLELNEGYPMLLRSNYVHTQTLSTIEPIWRCADENVGFIERKSIYWKNRNDKAMWYKINSYEELLDAYNCVLNFELYQHKDRDSWNYRKQQEKREGQQSNSSSTQGYEELFFHGCEDLETLNARYRNLCKTFHPDGKSGDEESFKKMQQAYENMKRRMSA